MSEVDWRRPSDGQAGPTPAGWAAPEAGQFRPPPGIPRHVAGPDGWPTQVRAPAWLTTPVQQRSAERPTYREPFPALGGKIAGGALLGALWMLLMALLASGVRSYLWLSLSAGLAAAITAAVLARFGDRGAAVGVAISAAFGVSVAMLVLILRAVNGDWLLW